MLAASARPATLAFGPFRVDANKRLLTANGRAVPLQPRAFDMLELFVACRGQVLSADEIVGHVWRGVAVGDNNLGVQLSALRRALAAHGGNGLIVTLPGRGYRFVGEVTEQSVVNLAAETTRPALPPPRRHATIITAAAAIIVCFGLLLFWRIPPSAFPLSDSFNPPPHSVAVLAFANLSNDPAQEYLSDGLSEAVIDILSRMSQLQVTARTSSFFFKGKQATIDQIARRLNVGSVLEGSMRRQGSHLRIDTHLSDARTGYQLWSQSYDVEMSDMMKLQDEIASAVAESLQAKLLNGGASIHSQGGTTNPQALDAYLRGQHHLLEGMFDQNAAAIDEFRKATELDPDFALALTELSSSLFVKAGFTMSTSDPAYAETLHEARRDVEHAMAVAPGLGRPHAQLGMVILIELSDFTAAWAEAVRARALTPGDVFVEERYADIARSVGRRNEAINAAALAVELDPLHAESWFTMWRARACAHQFDAAREALQRGVEVAGHAPSWAVFQLGNFLLKQGKSQQARRLCETSDNWTDICLAIAYHALGRTKDAEAQAEILRNRSGDDNSYNLADVYAQWNEPALAMKWLAKARQLNDPALVDLECDAYLDPIRNQPGFREIEQTLHLPPSD